MGFADLSSADAVVEAIRECDQLGEPAFLSEYGFGASRHVRLFYNGSDYPAEGDLGEQRRRHGLFRGWGPRPARRRGPRPSDGYGLGHVARDSDGVASCRSILSRDSAG